MAGGYHWAEPSGQDCHHTLLVQMVGVKVEILSLNATMELLGGFEQAVGRSVGYCSKVVVWVRSVTEELLRECKVDESLLHAEVPSVRALVQ